MLGKLLIFLCTFKSRWIWRSAENERLSDEEYMRWHHLNLFKMDLFHALSNLNVNEISAEFKAFPC